MPPAGLPSPARSVAERSALRQACAFRAAYSHGCASASKRTTFFFILKSMRALWKARAAVGYARAPATRGRDRVAATQVPRKGGRRRASYPRSAECVRVAGRDDGLLQGI